MFSSINMKEGKKCGLSVLYTDTNAPNICVTFHDYYRILLTLRTIIHLKKNIVDRYEGPVPNQPKLKVPVPQVYYHYFIEIESSPWQYTGSCTFRLLPV